METYRTKRAELKEKRKGITRDFLVQELKSIGDGGDVENNHVYADELLLAYISDDEVTTAFEDIHKWYA